MKFTIAVALVSLTIVTVSLGVQSKNFKIKSLRSQALQKSGLRGVAYLAHANGYDMSSPYVKTYLLSLMISQLLDIKEHIIKIEDKEYLVYSSMSDNIVQVSTGDTLEIQIQDWMKSLSILGEHRIIKKILLKKPTTLAIHIKNLFFKNTLAVLKHGRLCAAMFFLENNEMENIIFEDYTSFDKLRNAAALLIFKEKLFFLKENITEAIDSFKLASEPDEDVLTTNYLNLLSIASLIWNDELANKLISLIDSTTLTYELKQWIIANFGNNPRIFAFLQSKLNAAGWNLLANAIVPQGRLNMLTHMYIRRSCINFLNSTKLFYFPNNDIQIYRIDPFTLEVINVEHDSHYNKLVVQNVTCIDLIFPADTHVTQLMLSLLRDWAMGNQMTPSEERLARLIILVDQVTIIRHN